MERFDIGEVLARAPLSEVARRLGIEIERKGSRLTALCPFHQDTRPSLSFFPSDHASPEHFHCFACDAHGHAIDLVKQVQGVDFSAAVQWLAQSFGIRSARRQPTRQADRDGSPEGAQAFALRVFDECHDAPRFQAWCEERAFEADFLYRQGLRCISHAVLLPALESKGTGERVELIDGLLSLGLIRQLRPKSGVDQLKLSLPDQFQDYFHDGRVLIPIYSSVGKRVEVAGFAGRALQAVPQEGVAKYLLSPGFQKAKYLFNAPTAFKSTKAELQDQRNATLYLVEGFLDAIRMQSLGLNAVALMGTSLSDGQFELLRALVEDLPHGKAEFELSIFLDNDRAGFAGADRIARRLLGMSGVNLRWIGSDGQTGELSWKDPDSCFKGQASRSDAVEWLQRHNRPAEAVLLASEMGDIDASDLPNDRWALLNPSARERVAFKTAATIRQVRGSRPLQSVVQRLKIAEEDWAKALSELLDAPRGAQRSRGSELFLQGSEERLSYARTLAYHGSRRGELPCDEEVWLTLDVSTRLFDRIAEQRLAERAWTQAAPFDAVYLPRKFTAIASELDDPRRKAMPHAADLHLHQVLLNELLTQRHDLLSAEEKTFSAWIPAVRWYSGSRRIEVTGKLDELSALEDEEPTLSFGYQVDMDVLEGNRTPSDQGMFRPYGQCWRDFMASLSRQCHSIGERVHVLRLDGKRYYDSVQRYVVRDALRDPIRSALAGSGVGVFGSLMGLDDTGSTEQVAEALVDRICGFLFGYRLREPTTGADEQSSEAIGIPQGPVLSAYIGTIALFPVDLAARKSMRRNVRQASDGRSLPRVGYARYVDDIVVFADSEALLTELREELQAEAARLSITLVHKGERVRSGTPEEVMHQLNEGRSLAASVPAWEPPFIGDGEAGWGLGGDMPIVDRQCALKMLRHPALMDKPELIQEQIKQALQAPDLRPSDLGLCARWLWWQVATELSPELEQREADSVWSRYWQLWRHVCDGHKWAIEFERRGYDQLYSVLGLDRLLDLNPWMESDQTRSEVPQNRALRVRLARLVFSDGFFRDLRPVENSVHVARCTHLVVDKARRLVGESASKPRSQPQGTSAVTAIEWLCMAAALIRTCVVDPSVYGSAASPLAPIKGRDVQDAKSTLARQVSEVLRSADVPQTRDGNGEVDTERVETVPLAISFVIDNAAQDQRLPVLAKMPALLAFDGGTSQFDSIRLVPRLPIADATTLWGLGKSSGAAVPNLYRFSSPPSTSGSHALAVVKVSDDGRPVAACETWTFESRELNQHLAREKSTNSAPWETLGRELQGSLRLTEFAVRLFRAVVAMQRADTQDAEFVYVPFAPQLFSAADDPRINLHLVAEPVRADALGVGAWYRDGDGRVRTVSVPHAGAELWRAGWTVADILGMAVDMSGEAGLRDEQLPEKTAVSVERYLLRQQLRKLQGVYLSEAQTLLRDEQSGLPRTVLRALQLLSEFDGGAVPDQQVRQLLAMEAETRAMALRLQRRGGEGLRPLLHLVFPAVLNKLPLWSLEALRLDTRVADHQALRPELALMLSLCRAMEVHWTQGAAAAHHSATSALRASLALGTGGVALRGSVAALWGLALPRGDRRMSERLDLPVDWMMPDMARADPQADYSAMRRWLAEGDWPALGRASPWHWMLALVGLLDASFPQALEIAELRHVFAVLAAWQSSVRVGDDTAVWPYDGLPTVPVDQWSSYLDALPEVCRRIDKLLGMKVVRCVAPRYRRNPHTDEFADADNQDWRLGKQQFTGLGAEDRVERRNIGTRILAAWSETRRADNNTLLAVHTLDRKLGEWSGSDEPLLPKTTLLAAEHSPTAAAPEDESVVSDEKSRVTVVETEPALERSGSAAPEAVSSPESDFASMEQGRLAKLLGESQRASRANRGRLKSKAHFRVAFFQWQIEDTYAHPLREVGLRGLPIDDLAKAQLGAMVNAESDLRLIDRAAKSHEEYRWTSDVKVLSWHEFRRRTLLRQALNACKSLDVQLLVLPEVSVRPDTVEWLEGEMKDFEGLAVLAGTYRYFGGRADDPMHLRSLLTLLWRPTTELAKGLGLENENVTLSLKRGKKYRAVAAKELFRPDLDLLAPLYTEEKLVREVVRVLGGPGRAQLRAEQMPALANALVNLSPPLRYCMELICSELFLLTSPANYDPLREELASLTRRFKMPSADASGLVKRDIEALGALLTFAQKQRERRSVLLVPACTSRSNDYWHAGQASVLASGTATVFCNAAHKASAGGSCFIGINSVNRSHDEVGVVSTLTPYHGWQRGILLANSDGPLAKSEQALVVADIDPVHVVSGRPRPQLLPEPMSLVAYLPLVEVLDRGENAKGMTQALSADIGETEMAKVERLFLADEGRATLGSIRDRAEFYRDYDNLRAQRTSDLRGVAGAAALNGFVNHFGDPDSLRKRFLAWNNDRHQQPSFIDGALQLEPAWLDFMVADLTCPGTLPRVRVSSWSQDPEG